MERLRLRPTLIGSLPPAERRVVMDISSPADYPSGTSLLGMPGRQECLFVEAGLVSLHVVVGDHLSGSVGLVGPGGMLGVPSLLGMGPPSHQAVTVTPVSVLATPAADLMCCLGKLPALRRALSGYVSFRFAQALVSSACNLEHGLTQRLADWLVLASRLLSDGTVPVTHERLSALLGATRPSVTLALQSLEEQKAIRSKRGQVEVLDPARLQNLACGCSSNAEWGRADHAAEATGR